MGQGWIADQVLVSLSMHPQPIDFLEYRPGILASNLFSGYVNTY